MPENEKSPEALVRELAGDPLEVTSTGITVGDDGTVFPTAVLDVSDRPDVADLPRVHALDGIGDLVTTATRDHHGVALTALMSRPVTCVFQVRFSLPEHRELLEHAPTAGHLLFATTEPSAAGEHPPWLAIDLDAERLRAVLDGT